MQSSNFSKSQPLNIYKQKIHETITPSIATAFVELFRGDLPSAKTIEKRRRNIEVPA